jgi:hypothetical protein
MSRIDTSRHITVMQYQEAVWNRTAVQHPCNAMSSNLQAMADAKQPVLTILSTPTRRSGPQPATCHGLRHYTGFEAFYKFCISEN